MGRRGEVDGQKEEGAEVWSEVVYIAGRDRGERERGRFVRKKRLAN